MKTNMSKTKKLFFLIAIIVTTFVVMGDMVIYVITNNLYQAFPDHVQVVNFIISGPSMLVVIGSLIAPYVMKRVSKKNILIFGGIVYGASAIFTPVILNPYFIAIMRALTGLAIPFVHVAALAMIAEVYVNEDKRAWVMGLYNAIMPLIGSLMTLVTGFLAVKTWQNAFNIYWISVPMILLVIFFVPSIKSSKDKLEEHHGKNDEEKAFGKAYWIVLFQCMISMMGSMMLVYFQAVYIAEHNLGNEAFVGFVHTVGSLGSVGMCGVFGFVFSKLKRNSIYLSYIFTTIGCLLLYFMPGKIIATVAFILLMMSYGNAFSYIYGYIPTLVSPSKVDTAIGFGTAAYGLAGFLATYAVTALMGILKTGLFTPVILVILAVNIVLAVVETILPKKLKGHYPLEIHEE